MAESQIILDHSDPKFGWLSDRQLRSGGIVDLNHMHIAAVPPVQSLAANHRYYLTVPEALLAFPSLPPSDYRVYIVFQAKTQGCEIYTGMPRMALYCSTLPAHLQVFVTWTYKIYVDNSGNQHEWFNIPLPLTSSDIAHYNAQVLAAFIKPTLDVPWGRVNSTWWEELIPAYELSESTQLEAARIVDAYTQSVMAALENDGSPSLFGFYPVDIGNFFGFGTRTGLALIRLANKNAIPADMPYLQAIYDKGPAYTAQVAEGLKHLGEHPAGSHYSGDFSITSIVLDFATGGLYSIGMAGIDLISDIVNGDLSMSSISKFKDVVDLGVTAALRDISVGAIGNEYTQLIKEIIAAGAGIMGGISEAGGFGAFLKTADGIKSVSELALKATLAATGAVIGTQAVLPGPSTVNNPGGSPTTQAGNPVGIQNPYYGVDPSTGMPYGAPANDMGALVPIAALVGAFFIMK